MILSDDLIVQRIKDNAISVVPFERTNLRSASICLRLGEFCARLEGKGVVDLSDSKSYPEVNRIRIDDQGMIVGPKEFLLCGTLEKVGFGREHCGLISNLTGLARLGLGIALSGFVSPGYGEDNPLPLTLELYNYGPVPIRLYAGMRICHLIVCKLGSKSLTSYDSDVGVHSAAHAPSISYFHKYFR